MSHELHRQAEMMRLLRAHHAFLREWEAEQDRLRGGQAETGLNGIFTFSVGLLTEEQQRTATAFYERYLQEREALLKKQMEEIAALQKQHEQERARERRGKAFQKERSWERELRPGDLLTIDFSAAQERKRNLELIEDLQKRLGQRDRQYQRHGQSMSRGR